MVSIMVAMASALPVWPCDADNDGIVGTLNDYRVYQIMYQRPTRTIEGRVVRGDRATLLVGRNAVVTIRDPSGEVLKNVPVQCGQSQSFFYPSECGIWRTEIPYDMTVVLELTGDDFAAVIQNGATDFVVFLTIWVDGSNVDVDPYTGNTQWKTTDDR